MPVSSFLLLCVLTYKYCFLVTEAGGMLINNRYKSTPCLELSRLSVTGLTLAWLRGSEGILGEINYNAAVNSLKVEKQTNLHSSELLALGLGDPSTNGLRTFCWL